MQIKSEAGGVMETRPLMAFPRLLSLLFWLTVIVLFIVLGRRMVIGGEGQAGDPIFGLMVLPILVIGGIYFWRIEDPVFIADRKMGRVAWRAGDALAGVGSWYSIDHIARVEIRAVLPWVWYRAVIVDDRGREIAIPVLRGIGLRRLNRLVEEVRMFLVGGG